MATRATEPAVLSTVTPSSTPHPASTGLPSAASATRRATGLLVNAPGAFEGYTLFTPSRTTNAYLIDNHGRVVHRQDAKPHPAAITTLLENGNALMSGNREVDAEGNVVWDFQHPQNHDILSMPNGNVLILSRLTIPREEAIALGVNPRSTACHALRATHIVEVRPTGPSDGEIVWKWSAFDHFVQDFDPEKPNYGVVADHPELIDINFTVADAKCPRAGGLDWLHANALDYNAELDQIMITVRNFSEIWIIDHSTTIEEAAGRAGGNSGKGGDLIYRWGNPRAHRRGTAADQRLFRPHDAQWIPEGLPGAGNVLIFNNGAEYPGFERGYSSVDEFALPADGSNYRLESGSAYGPNEIVWTYAADPRDSFYASYGSSAQRLPNGNTLIADGPASRVFEVTAEGETVWEFVNPDANDGPVHNARRYGPNHQGIQSLLEFYRTVGRAAAASEPILRSVFDLYLLDGDLVYVKEECGQEDVEAPFFLHIVPERADDLPQERRRFAFDNMDFDFFRRGAAFEGKCVTRVALPDYPVTAVRTGQFTPDSKLWSARFWLNPEPQRAAYRSAAAGRPVARSAFDLYVTNGDLVYVRESCSHDDAEHRFFLHIVPERVDDLPQARRQPGFDNLGFDFFLRGAEFDGKCVAAVPLPDYAIASIRTGQFGPQGELWSAEFAVVGGGAPPP